MKRAAVLPSALVLALWAPSPGALAGPPPPATGSIEVIACPFGALNCAVSSPAISFPPELTTVTVSAPTLGSATSVGAIQYQPANPNETPDAEASAYVTAYPGSSVNLLFTSFFQFIPISPGASGVVSAPVNAAAGVSEGDNPSTHQPITGDPIYASVKITDVSQATPTTVFSACAGIGTICSGSTIDENPFDIAENVNFIAGDTYAFQLQIAVSFDNSTGGDHYATASIDPYVANDDPADFALLFSPNLVAVPEPSTWTMMLLGLGGLGAFARFRAPPRPKSA